MIQTEFLYMWFKIYQNDIKNDSAKWVFLHNIRKDIKLDTIHEDFYIKYTKKRGLIIK